jgi:hypothetical protein
MLPATATLPAVAIDPATAALATVAAELTTPALATVPAEPATTVLATVAAEPATTELEAVETDPATAMLAVVSSGYGDPSAVLFMVLPGSWLDTKLRRIRARRLRREPNARPFSTCGITTQCSPNLAIFG